MITSINDYDVTPQVGRYIKPDGWSLGECLIAGDSFSRFRIPVSSGGPIKSLAVAIEPTGRTLHRKWGDLFVRVKIIFLGDDAPDVHTHGYMKVG